MSKTQLFYVKFSNKGLHSFEIYLNTMQKYPIVQVHFQAVFEDLEASVALHCQQMRKLSEFLKKP